jgi:hypothetical protein
MPQRAPLPTPLPTVLLLTALWLAALPASGQTTSDRAAALTDFHGYFPCSDCHGDQETIHEPYIMMEEHAEPLEWEDDDGVAHLVPFGKLVLISDLLGLSDRDDLTAAALARVGRTVRIEDHMNDNDLSPDDSVWALVHGGGNLWCLDCHDADDRDKLVNIGGELLTFNQSHLLCGSCHGPILQDWERGIHGKTVGRWDQSIEDDGTTVRWVCVECHNPHAPAILTLMPEPAPVPRLGGRDHGAEHEEALH